MKINWKSKLSSRKFWAMLAALVISILTLVGCGELTAEQVAVLISCIGALCVYMLSESAVDRARAEGSTDEDGEEDANFTDGESIS